MTWLAALVVRSSHCFSHTRRHWTPTAALGVPWDSGTQITDLLAAADRALYRAKRAGRDQVYVVTDNAVVNSPAEVGRLGQV